MSLSRPWLATLLLALLACSREPEAPAARVVIAVTVDWEGAYINAEQLEQIRALRARLGDVPFTHFVSAGYLTKAAPDDALRAFFAEPATLGDEVAMHLHAWTSLAAASGVPPRRAPSFLTGTDQLVELEDDAGFDVDLDAYDAPALRAMLRTSRTRLEALGLEVSASFRAGGYLASTKLLNALRDEGYVVDSSAIAASALAKSGSAQLQARVSEVWPRLDASAQPFVTHGLLEMPIAAVVDYSTPDQIAALVQGAAAQVDAHERDVFVVFAMHQETATDFAATLGDALIKARADVGARGILFTTVEKAAVLARDVVASGRTQGGS